MGLSKKENGYFRERMQSYIDSAFEDGTLSTLTFVIHPHIQHLENTYKLYLDEIMKEVISENTNKENIYLIDFKNLIPEVYLKNGFHSYKEIFVKNDRSSPISMIKPTAYTLILLPISF